MLAEPSAAVPIQLVVVDPLGTILQTADASSGFAVVNRTVTQPGVYLIKLVNVGVGPVTVWSASTPLVASGSQ